MEQRVRIESEQEYPHVVIRWMAAVYGRTRLVYLGEGDTPGIRVPCARNAPDARERTLDAVQAAVTAGGHRMCVVFGPRDTVFVELDGRRVKSEERPSGGVRVDDVVVPRRPGQDEPAA